MERPGTVVGWCFATPVALEPVLRRGVRLPRLASVVSAATRDRDLRRHVKGRPGTLARRVPRDRGWYLLVKVTNDEIQLWDHGLSQREPANAPVLSFTRESLVSVVRTGGADSYGVDARFCFADGSFIDMQLLGDPELDTFWTAVA
jgi:hypothetical protein